MAVEQPLRGVVGVGLGQAVGVALGGDLLPVGEGRNNAGKVFGANFSECLVLVLLD